MRKNPTMHGDQPRSSHAQAGEQRLAARRPLVAGYKARTKPKSAFAPRKHVLSRNERRLWYCPWFYGHSLGVCLVAFTGYLTPHSLPAQVNSASSASSLAIPEPVLEFERQRIEAIAKASQPTISVFSPGGGGGGSGVVITSDGYALTNFHVSKPSGNFMKCSLPDGNLYDAVIVGLDPTGDVALIKLFGREDFPVAELADSDRVRVGDWCFAIGNPFLLATDFQPTVSYGIVSGVHRYQYPAGTLLEYADCIQTDAAINPGNSGGPLFDAQGRLIGINGRGSFEKRGRVNVGVGYAISINQIKNFLGYLRSGRIVDHATLGATVSSDEEGRVVVSNILENSDAYRRGLRYGDEIVSFGGREINTVNGFKNALGIYPKGWRVPLTYRRGDEVLDIWVRLPGVHRHEELIAKTQGAQIEEPIPEPKDEPKEEPKPDDGQEQPEKAKRPKIKLPEPGKKRPAKVNPHAPPPPPKELEKFFVEREGYANYYFNQLNRDRVWTAFTKASGDFAPAGGAWELTGQMAGGGPFAAHLANEEVRGVFPRGEARLELDRDLDEQLVPPESGGLLPALHLWRRLLVQGPSNYGDVYYLGTAPIPGKDKMYDVLVGVFNVVESKFYFDPDDGRLVLLEMFPDPYADPCEIHFDDYREAEGRQLPHRLDVRYGDEQYAVINVESVKTTSVTRANSEED
jgi:S1-C subfamily serine protease